jgi:hypothetical protein
VVRKISLVFGFDLTESKLRPPSLEAGARDIIGKRGTQNIPRQQGTGIG